MKFAIAEFHCNIMLLFRQLIPILTLRIATHAGPIAARDGHDLPGLINERVPGVAAVVDDIVEGFEDPV